MIPVITDQQRQALHDSDDIGPVVVVDDKTNSQYVLIRADFFDDMQRRTLDIEPDDAYPLVDRIMADDDAIDPTLASYQDQASPRQAT